MKLIKSFGYAFQGIKESLTERNIKIHLCVTLLVVIAGMFFSLSSVEWMFVLLAIGLVFSTELLNTALEKAIDVITQTKPETYPHMGRPKDIGAGAVLCASLIAFCIGLFVFWPHISIML